MARKERKYHFIYKTTNILSGKYYIGMHSTDNLEDGYMGSGNRLRLAIRKHGKGNFIREILEFCENRKELSDREMDIINLNEISKVECMNMRVGGCGGSSKKANEAYLKKLHNDPEFRERISKKAIENNLRLIAEGKLKTWVDTYDWNGKSHTEETKKKMSELKKGTGGGELNSQYGTCWITKDGENKKIKKDLIDIYLEDGWVKGREVNNGKKFYVYDMDWNLISEEFNISEYARKNNLNSSSICKVLNGKIRYHKGLIFSLNLI